MEDCLMADRPTYKELEQRIRELEFEAEKNKDETTLRDSRKRLVEAQRIAGMGDFTWDCESGETTWSEAMFDLLKYDKSEIIDYARVNAEIHHPDDLERITRWLNDNIASDNEILAPNEYRVLRKDGAVLYVRTVGVIERKNGRAIRVFATMQDITDLRRTEQALVRRSRFERLVGEISSEFLGMTSDRIDGGIERALAAIGAFSGADRAYVFLLRDNGALADNTHEWCADGIEPQIETLKDIPLHEVLPWFAEHIETRRVFHAPKVAELPSEAHPEREYFEALNIRSLIVVPMFLKGRPIGFLGFDAVREYRSWTEDDQAILRMVGQILTHALERKRVEEALRESEAKYRRLAENSPAVVYQFLMRSDGSFTFPYISESVTDVMGISAEEVLKDSSKLLDMVHPEDRDAFYAKILRSADDLDSYHEIIRCKKEGGLIWVEARATASGTSTGDILWDGFFDDITERKQAEAALRTAEETYRNIFLNAQVGLYRTDINSGLMLDANDAIARFIGFKDREALLAQSFSIAERYVDPEARENMISLLKRDGEFRNYEARFRRNDGSILWMRYSAKMIPEKGWIEGVSEDVTEQKSAEISLRESEKKFSKLFYSSPTWIAITRFEDGAFLEVNRAFLDMSGFEHAEIIGRTSLELGISADPNKRRQLMDLARGKGGFREQEFTFVTKSGETLTALWSADLIELAGETCLLSTIMDISELRRARDERRKLEKRLHRAQKMEAMGLLAGGVAHDLNNILSGIVTYPDLLLMDLPEDSPYRKPILTIQKSGTRASEVVSDLLTIARGVATRKEALNLNAVIHEVLGSAEFKELERTFAFVDFNQDPETDLFNINGSPSHIKKMLMNLIVNATEAIEMSGMVTIRTRNRYLDEPLRGYEDVRKGEYAVLIVSDDGSGISSEDMERIFEPFYTKKVMGRSGTGLGLAVVWNTVQDHEGYINVRSSERGTTFELYFPVTREKISPKEEALALEEYKGHGERILAVDDEESQREIVSGILTKLGYAVHAVSSGEEAVAYVKEHRVDLIVLDMVMPKGMNGHETYGAIIKIRPGQKAIIASGYAKTMEVEAAQGMGAGKYIKKPYTLEKIGLAVKEELEK